MDITKIWFRKLVLSFGYIRKDIYAKLIVLYATIHTQDMMMIIRDIFCYNYATTSLNNFIKETINLFESPFILPVCAMFLLGSSEDDDLEVYFGSIFNLHEKVFGLTLWNIDLNTPIMVSKNFGSKQGQFAQIIVENNNISILEQNIDLAVYHLETTTHITPNLRNITFIMLGVVIRILKMMNE
ncbi:hypothetical protein ACJX0J_032747 [Zea mays]